MTGNTIQLALHLSRISNAIEPRDYQIQIAEEVKYKNSLIVLPTSLGKTICALYVIDQHYERGKVLLMAPTKPLIDQHIAFLRANYLIPPEDFLILSGNIPPKTRPEMWKNAKVIIATPQVIHNDLKNNRYTLSNVSLIVFDECHRCSGDYSYAPIADYYTEQNPNGCILGMTATLPKELDYIIEKFKIVTIAERSVQSADVKEYTHEKTTKPIFVHLNAKCQYISGVISSIEEDARLKLRSLGYKISKSDVTMKTLEAVRKEAVHRSSRREHSGFQGMALYGVCMKMKHARILIDTQSTIALKDYFKEIINGDKGADKILRSNHSFIEICNTVLHMEEEHPKLNAIKDLVPRILNESDGKIIIFANYRVIVDAIIDIMNDLKIPAMKFVGQAKQGLTQKKQLETMNKFRNGDFSVLVSTSIGEEGLDVPSTDTIIFYEPVASKIRTVQRMGRTGRHADGTIYALITKNTADERNYYKNRN